MGKLTALMKAVLPPVTVSAYRALRPVAGGFAGAYPAWEAALSQASGYDAQLILEKVKAATLQVKAGNAAFERDTKLFDKPQYVYPVLSGLLRAAAMNGGHLRVLDFGGALGSSYFACRDFMGKACTLEWHVVEQAHFSACGRESIAEAGLDFYDNIAQVPQVDVVLLSSVLQYLEQPYTILGQLKNLGAQSILIDRTPFYEKQGEKLTVQTVPPEIYKASYPCWLLDEKKVCQALSNGYTLQVDYLSEEGRFISGRHPIAFKGMIWQKNKKK
jgi:putative methyltransferase (TIGR04325 family)